MRGCGVEIVEPATTPTSRSSSAATARCCARCSGSSAPPCPVIGVNFGRVGFLAAMTPEGMEDGLRRVLPGERRVIELPTLDVDVDGVGGGRRSTTSSARPTAIGRMVELDWAVGGEDLGVQPCDGVICATSTGSTAYNLSSGGPVLVWGLDAMAVTFVSPHSLHARPLVVPRGLELVVRNVTRDGAGDGDRRRPAGRRPPGRARRRRSGSASGARCSRCFPR